jgi:hypothetical protein
MFQHSGKRNQHFSTQETNVRIIQDCTHIQDEFQKRDMYNQHYWACELCPLRLALVKGPNIVGVSLPSPEEANRSKVRIEVICITTGGQSASLSWYQTPIWCPQPVLIIIILSIF